MSHANKMKHFKDAAIPLRNGKAVAALAVTLTSLRNTFLYPIAVKSTGKYILPENSISIAQAKELKKRVVGIKNWVGRMIK